MKPDEPDEPISPDGHIRFDERGRAIWHFDPDRARAGGESLTARVRALLASTDALSLAAEDAPPPGTLPYGRAAPDEDPPKRPRGPRR